MRFILILFSLAAIGFGQAIPGRYIVEFRTEPATAISASTRSRYSVADPGVIARRSQLRAEQDTAEQSIRSFGGRVRQHFDTVLNGVSVEVSDSEANRLRQLPNVAAVYPEMRHRMFLDRAVNVHKIRDAWQAITAGRDGAGAGIKVGIIDSGIDINHPAFQGFSTPPPAGYPIVSTQAERPNTNNKVIVARDYTLSGSSDTLGHGTGIAMVVAGLLYDPGVPGYAPFTGVAPGAWLGNYRIINDEGFSNTGSFLSALEDAINDGMNVVNYSAGSIVLNGSEETGSMERAIGRAVAAGVLVVAAAGNDGPDPGTIASPAVTPSAIAVAANFNERAIATYVTLGDLPPIGAARSGDQLSLSVQLQGQMVEVGTLGSDSLLCSAPSAGSLAGKIALISRGTCSFDDKVNNAQAGGAIGAVVYNNVPNELVSMALATAKLPAVSVTLDAGQRMKTLLTSTADAPASLNISAPLALPSDAIPYFSASGPTVTGGLKPDVLATGVYVGTASKTQGNSAPFAVQLGTSFSAPMVTGSLAVLMSSRPGLTPAQYRSLIVDSMTQLNWSNGEPVGVQTAGGGKLNLLRAVQNNVTAVPATVSFQTAKGTVDLVRTISIANVGAESDTFTAVARPLNTEGPVPTIDNATFALDKGASRALQLKIAAQDPKAGEYQGFIEITGTKSSVPARIPYWFGVPGGTAKYVSLITNVDENTASFGEQVSFYFRITDEIGMPFDVGTPPEVTTTSLRAAVISVSAAGSVPGTFLAQVRVGRPDADGKSIFTITSGDVTRDITFYVE